MQTSVENPTPHAFASVLYDKRAEGQLPQGFPIIRSRSLAAARKYRHVFVLCAAPHLPEVAELVSELNREHKLQALFVSTDSDPTLLPQMLELANLRLVRNLLVHSDWRVPHRVLEAWVHNAQAELIANATVADDRLIIISCEPKTYEVRFDQMPALTKLTPAERRNFEIADDGSFIWWPAQDIHLDLDAVRNAIDPAWRRKSERLRHTHGREYGAAIAALRKERGLKQTEVAGISERQLRRIERSGAISLRTLKQLADAHGMTLDNYMDAVAAKIGSASSEVSSVEGR